jgi:hypothetical protein
MQPLTQPASTHLLLLGLGVSTQCLDLCGIAHLKASMQAKPCMALLKDESLHLLQCEVQSPAILLHSFVQHQWHCIHPAVAGAVGEEAAEPSATGQRNSKQLPSNVQEFIFELFDKFVDPLLNHVHKMCKQDIGTAGGDLLWL